MSDQAPEIRTNIRKVVIVPFTDKTYRTQDAQQGHFALPINPENYSQSYKVEYDLRRGHGQQGTDPKFKSTVPEELKLQFVFDGTDTVEGYVHEKMLVRKQIETFKNTVYSMNGEIHRPRFLKLYWGEFVFPCILTALNINYTLFNEEGEPLRAKLDTTFVNYIAQEQRVARENKKSPDLTQVREAKAGDRLDLMTHKIYNQSKYVTQVARANDLTSFRNIPAGTALRFPPFDKQEV
jgi:hypothetical protein